MQIEHCITVVHISARPEKLFFQVSGPDTRTPRRDTAISNLRNSHLIADVDDTRGDAMVEISSIASWEVVEPIVLTQLIIGAAWDQQKVAVFDRMMPGSIAPTLRGIGHVLTENGHDTFRLTSFAA
jgi:hypothetical protein